MKVKFCPPIDSPLFSYNGIIGNVLPESVTSTRLTFAFEIPTSRGPWNAQISAEWGHVEVVSE